jgi:hypothetical protein
VASHKSLDFLNKLVYQLSTPHLLFVALSRSLIDYEVVDLLCSKPIVPGSRITSKEFTLLLGKFIYREARTYANLLLDKGPHVSIPPSEPHVRWSESPGQEGDPIAMLHGRDGVSLVFLARCLSLPGEKKHYRPRQRTG